MSDLARLDPSLTRSLRKIERVRQDQAAVLMLEIERLNVEVHNWKVRVEELEYSLGLRMAPRDEMAMNSLVRPGGTTRRLTQLLGMLLKREMVMRDAFFMAFPMRNSDPSS